MRPERDGIVVVGALNLDIVVYAESRPRPGETVLGTAWDMRGGGKGGNQAVQAAIHGARAAMVGSVGQDDFGATLKGWLEDAEVDTTFVRTDRVHGSGMGIGLIDRDAVPGGVVVPGCNAHLTTADVEAARPAFARAGVLLLQQEVGTPVNAAAAAMAREAGATVVLNAAPAFPVDARLARLVDVLVVNEVEAAALSGMRIDGVASARRAAVQLAQTYPTVMVTLGGAGVMAAGASLAPTHVPAFQVRAVDSLGAGDAFIGAFAARSVAGDPLVEAVEYATAVGAMVVAGVPFGPRTEAERAVRRFIDTQERAGAPRT